MYPEGVCSFRRVERVGKYCKKLNILRHGLEWSKCKHIIGMVLMHVCVNALKNTHILIHNLIMHTDSSKTSPRLCQQIGWWILWIFIFRQWRFRHGRRCLWWKRRGWGVRCLCWGSWKLWQKKGQRQLVGLSHHQNVRSTWWFRRNCLCNWRRRGQPRLPFVLSSLFWRSRWRRSHVAWGTRAVIYYFDWCS